MFPYPARISCCKVRTQGRFLFIAGTKRGGCVAEEGRPSLQVAPRRTVHLLPLDLAMVMAAGLGERVAGVQGWWVPRRRLKMAMGTRNPNTR